MIDDPEDEAFNEIERQAQQRKEAVKAAMRKDIDDDTQGYLSDRLKREWVGLTEDDIAQAMYRADAIFTGPMQFRFAGEIEAKLKEKNT